MSANLLEPIDLTVQVRIITGCRGGLCNRSRRLKTSKALRTVKLSIEHKLIHEGCVVSEGFPEIRSPVARRAERDYIRGARWCRGMFGALQPEGCGFESTSTRRVGTLGKSFTRNNNIAHALRRETPIQCPRCSQERL